MNRLFAILICSGLVLTNASDAATITCGTGGFSTSSGWVDGNANAGYQDLVSWKLVSGDDDSSTNGDYVKLRCENSDCLWLVRWHSPGGYEYQLIDVGSGQYNLYYNSYQTVYIGYCGGTGGDCDGDGIPNCEDPESGCFHDVGCGDDGGTGDGGSGDGGTGDGGETGGAGTLSCTTEWGTYDLDDWNLVPDETGYFISLLGSEDWQEHLRNLYAAYVEDHPVGSATGVDFREICEGNCGRWHPDGDVIHELGGWHVDGGCIQILDSDCNGDGLVDTYIDQQCCLDDCFASVCDNFDEFVCGGGGDEPLCCYYEPCCHEDCGLRDPDVCGDVPPHYVPDNPPLVPTDGDSSPCIDGVPTDNGYPLDGPFCGDSFQNCCRENQFSYDDDCITDWCVNDRDTDGLCDECDADRGAWYYWAPSNSPNDGLECRAVVNWFAFADEADMQSTVDAIGGTSVWNGGLPACIGVVTEVVDDSYCAACVDSDNNGLCDDCDIDEQYTRITVPTTCWQEALDRLIWTFDVVFPTATCEPVYIELHEWRDPVVPRRPGIQCGCVDRKC